MARWSHIVLLVVACALTAAVIYAIVTASWTLHVTWKVIEQKTGSLVVYDVDGKTILRSIDFGEVERGKTYTKQVIVVNNGTVALKLHLHVPNTACGSGDWGKLSWDREGYVLEPGKNVTATITLHVPSVAPVGTSCGVDVGIEGTES